MIFVLEGYVCMPVRGSVTSQGKVGTELRLARLTPPPSIDQDEDPGIEGSTGQDADEEVPFTVTKLEAAPLSQILRLEAATVEANHNLITVFSLP